VKTREILRRGLSVDDDIEDIILGVLMAKPNSTMKEVVDHVRQFPAGAGRPSRVKAAVLALVATDRVELTSELRLRLPEEKLLPGYHDLLNHLCTELRVCGAVTFWQAVADVKKRLGDR
jgi:hypothetical protein